MNSKRWVLLAFIAGAGIGSVCTWQEASFPYTLATTTTGTDPGVNVISSIGCYLLSTAILG